jgi:nitroreductase
MNEVIQNMINRRSIRKYQDKQIKDEELELILKAGMYAPTGMGKQSPIMIVVQDKETIQQLSKLNASVMGKDIDPFYGAPTVIIVLADSTRPTWKEDGSLVMGNLMNAASSLNIGSCWIHRAYEVFNSEEGKQLLKKWGVEGDYNGVGHCILGYKDNEPTAIERKENYIYYVK